MAVYGLQVWDEFGRLIVSPEMRLGRVLGFIKNVQQDGSIYDPGFETGTPFATFLPVGSPSASATLAEPSFSGNTLLWRYASTTRVLGHIFYGVY